MTAMIIAAILSGIVTVLILIRWLQVPSVFLVFVWLVPYGGPLSALGLDFLSRTKRDGKDADHIDAMLKADEEDKHQMDTENDRAVPLEDALIMDDSSTRRQIMMDILMSDHMNQYLPSLNQAKDNNDVEVAHYASSAVTEVNREYEKRNQKLESAYRRDPDNMALTRQYAEFLDEYIRSGLLDGSMLSVTQETYRSLLRKIMQSSADVTDVKAYIRSLLDSNQLNGAEEMIAGARMRFPHDDDLWMLEFRCAYLKKDGLHIKRMIQKQEQNAHISPSIRELIRFYRENEELNEKV